MASLREVVCIHGVSERRDATGFSSALRVEVERQSRKHGFGSRLRWTEVVWSDLSDLAARGGLVNALDMALDVIRYDRDAALAQRIRETLRGALLARPGAVLVAHSLGSVVACDVLCKGGVDVSSLVTLGSPLGLAGAGVDYRSRAPLAASRLVGLDWLDVYSSKDVVHTGALGSLGAVTGALGLDGAGYPCESREIDLGANPIQAHTGYWRQPLVARWVLAAASKG